MAKKDNNQNGFSAAPSLGEIGTIRDILMGPQITEIFSKLEMLQQNLDTVQDELNNKISSLKEKTNESSKTFQKETNDRFKELEKSLTRDIADLKKQVEKDDKGDRARIAKLLLDAGNSLLSE